MLFFFFFPSAFFNGREVQLMIILDYKIYEHVVDMTHKFKDIFYDSNA